jgi:DNA-binding transcriptional LysR family regulator
MTKKKNHQTPPTPLFELRDLELFSSIVREKSFTRVSEKMGIPKSSLSRRISELEERTGAHLINRTTRSLEITDLGEELYRKSQVVLAAVIEAEDVLSKKKRSPGGTLRIQTPVDFALPVLQPLIQEFSDAHPEYCFEVSTAPIRRSVEAAQFDFLIQPEESRSRLLAAVELPAFEWELVASPVYLDHEGTPEDPEDLKQHRLITNGEGSSKNQWSLFNRKEVATVHFEPWLKTSNLLLMRSICAAGYGVALVPSYLVEEELMIGTLVRVLPEWKMNESRMILSYAKHRAQDSRLKPFLKFISRRMGAAAA